MMLRFSCFKSRINAIRNIRVIRRLSTPASHGEEAKPQSVGESIKVATAFFKVHGKLISAASAASFALLGVAVVSAISLTSWKGDVDLEVEQKNSAMRLEIEQKNAAMRLEVEQNDKTVRLEAAALRLEIEQNDKAVRLEAAALRLENEQKTAALLLEVERNDKAVRLAAAQKDKEHSVATLALKSDLLVAVARAENAATSQVLDFVGLADYERLSKMLSDRASLAGASQGPVAGTVKAGE